MRSLAFIAVFGSLVASTNLAGQSLTEHAAAAAGATIGTAAGKPLGTALGKIFGDVDATASTAITPKNTKPVVSKPPEAKPTAVAPPAATGQVISSPASTVGGGYSSPVTSGGGSNRSSVSRREIPVRVEEVVPAPFVPVVPQLVIKEPTTEDVGRIQMGATSAELLESLGAAESTVSIPGDDGHLLEIRQYWSNGALVGSVRLDNGLVVSVQTAH